MTALLSLRCSLEPIDSNSNEFVDNSSTANFNRSTPTFQIKSGGILCYHPDLTAFFGKSVGFNDHLTRLLGRHRDLVA